jgi:hypothetical protein
VLGVSLCIDYNDLFVYGEVLQDRNVPEEEYAGYFGQTASSYGHVLREVLWKRSAKDIDVLSWYHRAAPEYLTTWVESHDTYCNANESAGLTDAQIRTGWVFLTARQNGTPLFYSRPMNSTRENYFGDNLLGARGNDEFFHPEVVAVNKFRQAMDGQIENIQNVAPDRELAGALDLVIFFIAHGDQTGGRVRQIQAAPLFDPQDTVPQGPQGDLGRHQGRESRNDGRGPALNDPAQAADPLGLDFPSPQVGLVEDQILGRIEEGVPVIKTVLLGNFPGPQVGIGQDQTEPGPVVQAVV